MRIRRLAAFLVPVAIGAGVLLWVRSSAGGPVRIPAREATHTVRVIRVEAQDVVPRALAYGTVEPGRIWRAVAQVGGRVVDKDPRLEVGALLPEGTVLVTIDPKPYELAVSQVEAEIAAIDARLAESQTSEANTRATLVVERRSLDLSQRDVTRMKELLASGDVSAANVDQQERTQLEQLTRVQQLENSLALVPVQQRVLTSDRHAAEARLDSARLDLSYTVVVAPFDCRIVAVDVEKTQFVGVGEVLAEAHGIETAEISAQVPIDKFRALLPTDRGPLLLADFVSGDALRELGVSATVRLSIGEEAVAWDARVDRIEGTLDPETRTLGVVVVVDAPYEGVQPGVRPPLVHGMFCEVELVGQPKPGRVAVPRIALHDGTVSVVEDGRLRRRAVEVDFVVKDLVCLRSGLQGGETVVVSDPLPAIDGMLLDPEVDVELQERLAATARGEGGVR